MKLVAFTLENYRSIRQSRRLVLGEGVTTLVGPNNEGKSNILRALVAALKIIINFDRGMIRVTDRGTVRLGSSFVSGQLWNDGVKATVKAQIAEAVAKSPKQVLNKATRTPLDNLVRALEERIEKLRH